MAQKKRLHSLFSVISLAGTPFFYVPAALLIAFFSRTASVRLAILLFVVEALCGILKFVCPKERPIPLPRKTLYQRYNAGSFPSIHTARIAAMSVFLVAAYPSSAAVAAGAAAIAEHLLPLESDPESYDDHENIRLDVLDRMRAKACGERTKWA